MKEDAIWVQVSKPESVQDVLALAESGAKVKTIIRPSLSGRSLVKSGSEDLFELSAFFSVECGYIKVRFEKTYASGHQLKPVRRAAMAFLIANVRLQNDIEALTAAGVECDHVPFSLTALIPGADLGQFAPKPPYSLEDFAIIAGIGEPVDILLTKLVKEDEKGERQYIARYDVICHGLDYTIEKLHATLARDAGAEAVKRSRAVAAQRLDLEQRKLIRLGTPILTTGNWEELEEEKNQSPEPPMPQSEILHRLLEMKLAEDSSPKGPAVGCQSCGQNLSPAPDSVGRKTKNGVSLRLINGWGSSSPEKSRDKGCNCKSCGIEPLED